VSQEETPPDQQSADEQAQSAHIKENVKSRSTWLRLFFMIVVTLLYAISRVVVGGVVVLQFFWVLFTGATNKQLEQLGQSLATYTYQIIRYLTFNTDERPFPFDADWPTKPPEA
jgi:hypothetical protein